ncbi:hypothetical protein [Hyphomicrobium sp. DY-1]|jgi:hypothetical protein|uniref:hypothetical protein n=1 Tax=Hyphomicrobium sp. DY-1 TaxID=3075650 RepID=UPI0039C3E050
MRQSRVLAQQVIARPRRVENFRRKSWTPRTVRRSVPVEISEPTVASNYIPGEFEEPQSPLFVAVKRTICLTWDVTILTVLSPFFAIWFLYRGAKRLTDARPQKG